MSQACPLLFRQIDGTITRINALWVVVLLMLFLATEQTLWLFILATDFVMRLYVSKSLSPLYHLSGLFKKMLRLQSRMADAGAKRLAAHFGLLFSILLLMGHYLGLEGFTTILGGVFVICAGMEFLLNYCVGCKIHVLWQKIAAGV